MGSLSVQQKRERLKALMRARKKTEIYPVSFAQQRLWFLDYLEGSSATYNIRYAIKMTGDLHVDLLHKSLNAVVARHDCLRTDFQTVGDQPQQVVHPFLDLELPTIDLSGVTSDEWDTRIEAEVKGLSGRPFQLTQAPLLRAALLHLDDRTHVLVLVLHHIITDGISMGILVRECVAHYQAGLKGEELQLEPLPLQYGAYSQKQVEMQKGDAYASRLKETAETLKSFPHVLEMPTDFPRPAEQQFRGERVYFDISAVTVTSLKEISRQHGVTPFMTLLSVFSTLVSRTTGQSCFLLGTPHANRSDKDTRGMIGLFVNTLVLPMNLSGNPNFREILLRTKQTMRDVYANQDLPFEQLVAALKPERTTDRNPLFQVMFEQQNGADESFDLQGLSLERLPAELETSKFDILFSLTTGDTMTGYAEYDVDLFQRETIENFNSRFIHILELLVNQPDTPFREMEVLSTQEREHLLQSWNQTQADVPFHQCLHELFRQRALRWPEKVACVYADAEGNRSTCTYAQLDRASDGLASQLLRLGLGNEQMVPVLGQRSDRYLVTLLGVFKAGCVYLPLDPFQPAARQHAILQDLNIPVIIGSRVLDSNVDQLIKNLPQTKVLWMEDDFQVDASVQDRVVPVEQMAYVIFTSGSTGTPKGAMVTHDGMVNHLYTKIIDLELEEGDVIAQNAPQSFDISIWQFLNALLVGGTTVVVHQEVARDPSRLLAQVLDEKVTVLEVVPSLLGIMLEEFDFANHAPEMPELRWLVATGEALPPAHCRRWLSWYPTIPIVNAYGPTECSDDVTHYRVSEPPHKHLANMPIGHAVANMRLYILDASLRPVPRGVIGQIFVGGIGVGRGYLNNPKRTASVFLPDPFAADWKEESRRLYATGDLGRYLPQKDTDKPPIEFLGRIDHQVKIRGFRIELGEIEAAMNHAPQVAENIVTVSEAKAGDKVLVGYFKPEVGTTDTSKQLIAGLRDFLKSHLPEYMIPGHLIPLDKFPTTPNGKIDRKNLPEPNLTGARSESFVKPGTPLEEKLAAIWRDILGHEQVGIHDNFFDLGGHSLLLVRLHKQISLIPGAQLSVVDLFKHVTIGDQAKYLYGEPDKVKAASGHREQQRAEKMRQALGTVSIDSETRNDAGYFAIVGMACRFPGAAKPEIFWQNLADGKESITRFDDDALLAEGVPADQLTDQNYVKAGAVLDGVEDFDADFFGMTRREAELMDPQVRSLLECAHEALEHGGYNPARYDGRIGVYVGTGFNKYLINNLIPNAHILQSVGEFALMLGNSPALPALQISYRLDLHGPSLNLNTACSTSLVTVHEATKSLRAYESDMALAGGATIKTPHRTGYMYVRDGVRSPDGHCRAFDAQGAGTVFGNGAGMVLIKRLADAREDGDTIHAVIAGSAVNNDGARKVGITAPSVSGQSQVIADAQALNQINPESISYLEAHGTGTHLGDPIEIAALEEVFKPASNNLQYCALGSVKTNVGHLDCAAGVAGLIKTTLALKNRQIPPSLHFSKPNPEINFAESPFYINTKLEPWESEDHPRRAGVSSFGIGGTNAHVILEEAPEIQTQSSRKPSHLLLLSARSSEALDTISAQLGDHLTSASTDLADIAYTLQIGRAAHTYRRFLVAKDLAEAQSRLARVSSLPTSQAPEQAPPLYFLFPGQGTQYAGMGKELYEKEPVYHQAFNRCAEILDEYLEENLCELLFDGDHEAKSQMLAQTQFAQPAIFATAYAAAQLLDSWGIRPNAMLGHSIGEYVAATLAGTFSLEDALFLVASRGRLMGSMPKGNMLALPLPESEVRALLPEGVSIAALNGPNHCVVSGPSAPIEAMAAQHPQARPLHTSHAFHSSMMDPILSDFRKLVEERQPQAPQRPFISNVTGTWITEEAACSPDYWAQHLRETVYFKKGLETLIDHQENALFLEVGAGNALSSLAKRTVGANKVFATLPHPKQAQSPCSYLYENLGKLWSHGIDVSWESFYREEQRRRVPLPTYPFERKRHWIDPPKGAFIPGLMAQAPAPPITESNPVSSEVSSTPSIQDPPTTEMERQIAAYWQELLGVESVGVHDSFFDLGGDSLIATQLLARLRVQGILDWSLNEFFDNPTIAQLASAKQEIASTGIVIRRAPADVPAPLSFAQRRLWFIDQLAGPQSVYNIPQGLRLKGVLDLDALRWTMGEILKRHEILRTTFVPNDSDADCVITPWIEPEIQPRDLTSLLEGLGDEQQQKEIDKLADLEARHAFNLATGPLWRLSLLKINETDHLLLLNLHHTVADAWSLGILINELVQLYGARVDNTVPDLPELNVQYTDYAHWQKEWLEHDSAKAQANYWQEKLEGLPPLLELPLDKQRKAEQTYRGDVLHVPVSPELESKLSRLGKEQEATLFVTMLAAYKILLARYSGQSDFAVGSPIAGRVSPELEPLIGMFVNTLVLRTPLLEGQNFGDVVQAVKRTALDAYDHQQYPFEKVVDILDVPRNLSHSPLFQTMFVLLNVPKETLQLPNLTSTPVEIETGGSMFDLTLWTRQLENGLRLSFEYNADLFEPATIEAMSGHYLRLLDAVTSQPNQPIDRVSMLTESEQHRVLVTFNETNKTYPGQRHLVDLIESTVQRVPQAPALTFEGETLSFYELDNRANQLAHRLRGAGVSAESIVGVCMHRSLDLVVALVGILKAGGAYMPLAPDLPSDRLAFMIADAQASTIICFQEDITLLPDGANALVMDDSANCLQMEAPPRDTSSSNAAYCIYTSGSTGKPKGVINSHWGITNRLFWMQDAYALTENDRVMQKTPFSFDVSVWEFFWPLITGAQMVIARPEGHQDPEYLVSLIQEQQVTTMHFVPSMLRVFLEAEGLEQCTSLARVFCSGEALPLDAINPFYSRLKADLHNLYGPTEAAIDVTAYSCPRTPINQVPIGMPIANTQTYVMDRSWSPAAIGLPGELCLGGQNLARGYLGRPSLTAEKFVPNPYAKEPGDRLYRTGDLARLRTDGQLIYQGRIDHQIKLRGFRIEIGEIESAIAEFEGVGETVVLLREEGAPNLVAYLTWRGEKSLDREAIRSALGKQLPEYMVPRFYVTLDNMPVTANGKLDRKALPAPTAADHGEQTDYEAPVEEKEQIFAEIWAEVLGVPQVSRNDNFFSLGGDSILGIQIVTRASKAGLRITPRDLFQHQTVAELAQVAETHRITAEQGPVTGTMPLTPVQRWFFDKKLADAHHFNQSLFFKLTDQSPSSIERALSLWLAHHDTLRLRFFEKDGIWQQEHLQTAEPVFHEVDLSMHAGDAFASTVEDVCNKEQASLSLEDGQLVRALFIHGGTHGNRLLLVVHHLIVDGVSWRILLEDLVSVLNAPITESNPLPPKTTSFKDWSLKLADYAGSAELSAERDYWMAQALKPATPVPRDMYPPGPVKLSTAATVKQQLSAEETTAFLQEVPQAYNTRADEVLLAALVQTFARTSHNHQLRVDLEGHGREELFDDVDITRTVGWFTTIYPVVLETSDVARPEAALKGVKDQIRAIPNKGIGYGLFAYMSKDQQLSQLLLNAPKSEILFNYLGQLDQGNDSEQSLQVASESDGQERSQDGAFIYPLEINSYVSGGQLHVSWTYSTHLHNRATVENLASTYQQALSDIIQHCLDPEAGGLTVSDIPEMDMDQDELDFLMSELD